jgi:hypothetical protein
LYTRADTCPARRIPIPELESIMPPTPVPPEKRADVERLAREIQDAVAAEIDELAANLLTTDDAHLFGDNEFQIKKTATKAPA